MGVLKEVKISKELQTEMIETAQHLEDISAKLTLELGLSFSHKEFLRIAWVMAFLARIAEEYS